jgi:phosphohistidine phosphatase SixA
MMEPTVEFCLYRSDELDARQGANRAWIENPASICSALSRRFPSSVPTKRRTGFVYGSARLLRAWAALLLLIAVEIGLAQENSALPVSALSAQELLTVLRQGGLILYFRHTATDFGQSDEAMTSFEDCTQQRNLTEAGREQARSIGAAVRELAIPVGLVLSSPYCRTSETAQLVFGRREKSPDLIGGAVSSDPERYAALRRQLASKPMQGNTMLVGHGNPFRSVAGAPHLSEGEAAVVRPLGDSGFEIIARIRVDEWRPLAQRK